VPASARVYRRRRIVVFGSALLVLLLLFYLALTLLAPLKATQPVLAAYAAPATTTQTLSLPRYGDSAIAAVGYPGLLAHGGGTRPIPIASITKIVTALVVLQKRPLSPGSDGPQILFTSTDEQLLHMYAGRDGDVYPIRVGGTMSERDVLTIALVASANNYARALVDWAYGSEANFLPVARAWLKSHGLSATTLTDCTGLNPQNTSTPADLIKLGELALADPTIAPIVHIKTITLPVVGTIKNTNELLGVSGIDGIKTGTLNSAGASLLFSSQLSLGGHSVTLVGVVLDGPTHPVIDKAIHALVNQARAGFRLVTVARKGQAFARFTTMWSTRSAAVATKTTTALVWAGTPVIATVSADPVQLERAGTIVGVAHITAGTQQLSVPLVLSTAISDPGPLWRLTHPGPLL
jgi:D-alanyl-D-alanine carboxypeptidase (penicillin-binding protein 5/6)